MECVLIFLLFSVISGLVFNKDEYYLVETCGDVMAFNYKQTPAFSAMHCAILCSQDTVCQSFSIPVATPNVCFLNNATFADTGCAFDTFHHFSLGISPERPCLHGGNYNTTTSDCICYHGYIGNRCQRLMQDCSEGFDQPYYIGMDAMFLVHPRTSPYPIKVFCEMKHGGKLVVLRRTSKAPDVDFNRTFAEYKEGFGELEGNAWLGLQKLHYLTTHRIMTLKITARARTAGKPEFRKRFYNAFQLLNESNGFYFTFLTQEPDPGWPLGDCLATGAGMPFSTIDNDQDNAVGNCAMIHLSGWWFKNCGMCNPTGRLQPKSELIQNNDPAYIRMPIQGDLAVLELLNESNGFYFTFLTQEPDPGWPLGDCLATGAGMPFSTIDNDQDNAVGNCAMIHLSGWWFKNCGMCNPTGRLQPKSELIQNNDPAYIRMPIQGDLAVLEVKIYLTYFG